ncbi:hypothetical protein HH310_00235 [Actinoplanes sp. TBRC 11911]|uniref:hypothetical protein n=1 Tax=Actinoplanes sp. TBRC 11911 TaxID=2729386 RepID=UPI00145EAFD8|nr:hypothetical protein [Actinoplanes sp. TBRC 11911]NMO49632.1 hypothetical protein [Actinoplanes sp. TBRC 11911]
MHILNRIFLVNSLLVVLVSVERFSATTDVILQPHSFLSLHQLVQTCVLILAGTVTFFWTFFVVSGRLRGIPTRATFWLAVTFVVGTYLYGAGEGLHEVSSYLLNSQCPDPEHAAGTLCGGLFVNDFYTGNILFFVGAFLTTAALLLAERLLPNDSFGRRDLPLLGVNAVVFAATVVAYAAFDTVLAGLVFSLVTLAFTVAMWLPKRRESLRFPVTVYSVVAYGLGSIVAVVIRLF